jgi:hypothetical protein
MNAAKSKIDTGRTSSQQVAISLSYRKRGKETRDQTKRKEVKPTTKYGSALKTDLLNIKQESRKPLNNMALYSAIKRTLNRNPPYSTLKPETSSDSPSAKSKGVRLTSAIAEKSHKRRKGETNHPQLKDL